MSIADWDIHGPTDFGWTPAELAQIAQAAQTFVSELPNASGKLLHQVTLNGVRVLPGDVEVTWPQPNVAAERVRTGTCPFCGREDCIGAAAHGGG